MFLSTWWPWVVFSIMCRASLVRCSQAWTYWRHRRWEVVKPGRTTRMSSVSFEFNFWRRKFELQSVFTWITLSSSFQSSSTFKPFFFSFLTLIRRLRGIVKFAAPGVPLLQRMVLSSVAGLRRGYVVVKSEFFVSAGTFPIILSMRPWRDRSNVIIFLSSSISWVSCSNPWPLPSWSPCPFSKLFACTWAIPETCSKRWDT